LTVLAIALAGYITAGLLVPLLLLALIIHVTGARRKSSGG